MVKGVEKRVDAASRYMASATSGAILISGWAAIVSSKSFLEINSYGTTRSEREKKIEADGRPRKEEWVRNDYELLRIFSSQPFLLTSLSVSMT